MAGQAFVVDRKLGAVPVSRLLGVRTQVRVSGVVGTQVSIAGDKPVLTGGQTLEPDALYPSGNNPSLRYFLPRYRVAAGQNGRPSVQLLYAAGAGDEIGRLTVTLAWSPPQASGVDVRAMEHVAALVLRFRVAVESAAGGAAPQNTIEQSMALQPLQQLGNQLARSTTIFTDKAQFDTVYLAMSKPDRGAVLDLTMSARVSIKTWRQVVIGRPAAKDQAMILENRQVLFTQMLHKETLATMRAVPATSTARVEVTAPPPDVRERVEATRAVFNAQPQVAMQKLQLRAAAPRVAVPFAAARMRAPAAFVGAPAAAMMSNRPAAAVAAARVVAADPARVAMLRPAAAAPAAATVAAAPTMRRIVAQEVSTATLARIYTPQLKQAVAVSDFQVAGRKAVPINVALDTDKSPASIDSDVENRQSLPFAFDPGNPDNADVFSVTGFASGGIHLLLPLLVISPDGSQHTVYQDNLMPDVIHIAPSEFRLERDPTAPFLPAISFLASEFSTTDNDHDAEVLFRVAAVYRLEPWLDPDVVALARAQLAQKGLVARFTAAVPHEATLTLDLDLLGGAQMRNEATIDPTAGITDTLDLDHLSFLKLWRERLAPERGGGVSGRVAFRLFDNSQTEVAVRLSLWESSADLFDVAFAGPVAEQPGRYRMIVRNRIESPASISALPGEEVDGGVAHAVEPQTHVGQLLRPGESRQIDYAVGPEVPPILSFEPTVIGRAEPNLSALLKLLMVTPGYSALGFALTVKAADGAFAQPATTAESLTGLLVEFDDGTRVNLSPSMPQADVTLVGRLIDQILGTGDDSQRYFYRVTNLHASGEGARTSWREEHGPTPLQVGTAVVTLDF